MSATPTSAPVLVAATGEFILSIHNITVGSNFFFVTETSSGQRLWRSDGTTANTVQVFEELRINPLLVYHSQLYLRVNSTATGAELWKMDGSYNAALLKDINPGPEYGYQGSLMVHNDQLYFFADAGTGTDLWQSNGTTAGTVLLVDFDDTDVYNPSGFRELTSVNNLMFFTRDYEASEPGYRVAELWKSDATAAGTSIVTQYNHDTNFYNYLSDLIAFNGKLYFFHTIGDPPFTHFSVSDGTASGTQHLELVSIDGQPRRLINAESWLLYYAESQSYTTPITKSDGSTSTIVHEFSMYHSTQDQFINLTYTDGRAFFTDDIGPYYGGGEELWQADLASGVTQPLQDIYDSAYSGTRNIVPDNGAIFFTRAGAGQMMSLWYYDPDAPPVICEGTGNIFQEIWVNAAGTDVRTFDFSTQPNGTRRSFTSFETTQFFANDYASRMRGWICVPQSGDYTFWISSDDQSELYLSTDESETNKQLIAWVYGYTPFRKYDKYPSQQSMQINLQAGQRYYIEARHKEGNGNDFISVGWQLPSGAMERPIAGNRLIPFTPPSCEGTGTIVREIWTNIPGTSVSSIPVNSPPNTTVELTSFATPNYYANNYGSRIRGYLCVPATGAYRFWIASDDNSELWLSDTDDPAGKTKIASVTGSTSVNQWNKYSSQMSGNIQLVQGQRYYIEVLHKEANGGDHVEVGWQIPSGPLERPIPGNRLIPFDDPSTSAAAFAVNEEVFGVGEENTVSIYPNPAVSGNRVSISLPGGTNEDVLVDIKSITGVSVQNEMLSSTGESVTIDLKPSIAAGFYLVRVSNNKRRWATKLQVK
jgi:ELWxxDGT repeat protein